MATRRAALKATLDSVPDTNTDRIDTLTTRIANLDARLMELDAAIDNLNTRIEDLNARVLQLEEITVRLQDRITRLENRCAAAGIDPNTGQMTDGSGGTTTSQVVLSYLHADHLGRPAFATDTAGTIIWDGGITTPFGMQIETMGAVTQSLMFPGQYQDEETGLYQNWTRTYDPTLGHTCRVI